MRVLCTSAQTCTIIGTQTRPEITQWDTNNYKAELKFGACDFSKGRFALKDMFSLIIIHLAFGGRDGKGEIKVYISVTSPLSFSAFLGMLSVSHLCFDELS